MAHVSVVLADACHARPASRIAQIALEHPGTLTLTRQGALAVDASSVLALMAADFRADETLRIDATGPGADVAAAAVAAILTAG